jgi:acyl carrier protein
MNELLSEKHARIVEDILIETLEVNRDQLKPEALLVEDLGADSLDVVEITMLLEERLDISIPDETSETAKTVGQMFEAVSDLNGTKLSPNKLALS